MLEWLLFPAVLGVAAIVPQTKQNDKKKIQTIFENTGYGIRTKKGDTQFPKFKRKLPITEEDAVIGTRYLYMIPLGLPATKASEMEKNVGFFTDGLNRPVITEFRRITEDEKSPDYDPRKYLMISVFNKGIPNLYPYAKVPDREGWLIPLGRTLEGIIWHDFDEIPHMTVAGMTRFGKTVFLKVLTTYIIEHHGDDAEIYIIDLKGGLEFGRYESLRQVKKVASNAEEAYQLLFFLANDQDGVYDRNGNKVKDLPLGIMQEDYKLFRKNRWTNIKETPLKRRRFIIVDEAAQIAPEKWMDKSVKDMLGACQYFLGEITRIGGGLGYHEIFCTQYPTADTLPRSIKQNADGKISFRLPTGYGSEVAIDETGAEKLPSNIRGRALYKTHEIKEMQVPFIKDDDMWGRLAKYQEPTILEGVPECVIEYPEKDNEARGNITKF